MTAQPDRFLPLRRQQGGIAAVEFAVTVFMLLLIGAGLVEFGRAFWYYDAMAKGTRDAARYLSTVNTGSLAGAAAMTREIVVRAASTGGVPNFTDANVSIACQPSACNAAVLPTDVTSVTVSASYPIGIGSVFPFIGMASADSGSSALAVTLSAHTTMPYMW